MPQVYSALETIHISTRKGKPVPSYKRKKRSTAWQGSILFGRIILIVTQNNCLNICFIYMTYNQDKFKIEPASQPNCCCWLLQISGLPFQSGTPLWWSIYACQLLHFPLCGPIVRKRESACQIVAELVFEHLAHHISSCVDCPLKFERNPRICRIRLIETRAGSMKKLFVCSDSYCDLLWRSFFKEKWA